MIRISMRRAFLCLLSNCALQRGAAINLVAVAEGGGEAALEWAVGALEAASGQAPQVGLGMLGGLGGEDGKTGLMLLPWPASSCPAC